MIQQETLSLFVFSLLSTLRQLPKIDKFLVTVENPQIAANKNLNI